MHDIKISLITVVFNAQATIERCITSVLGQKFNNIQYIVIDGGSTDDTIKIINRYRNNIDYFISEPDNGIYDAMNKGIMAATGDIIGMLNADDYLADDKVLSDVAHAFSTLTNDVLYGDLDFVDNDGKVVRKWRSGPYKKGIFNYGWMPPHPTFYCRRVLFEKYGNYSLEYGSAADYELMLRFIHAHKARVFYLDKVMIKMITGGVSNKSLTNRVKALLNDLKAMRNNDILFPYITIIFKPVRKISQFF
ncbi:MAG TPA: glycosyltransferase family 2 protein [Mucilaginibacter sp.]|nr:glycosyltransferase family 2 protein [Mucilaginibacter sp.]